MTYTTPTPPRPYGSYYNPYQYGKKKKGIKTFPIGEDLMGFESLTSAQQGVSSAFSDALLKLLQGNVSTFTPTPFSYVGVNPADVGSLQDMLNKLNTQSTQANTALETLMKGASAEPGGDINSILAGIPTFGGELGSETRSALAKALSGEFPEEYFQASVAGPTREQFATETAPAIREEFAGPGTFWGTARGGAVTGEQGKMERNLAAVRGELGNEAQNRALQAVNTSITARQNQLQLALAELNNRRTYATGQQQTALQAALGQIQKQQTDITAAANELNRLSQGRYQEITLAQDRWMAETKTAYDEYIRKNPAMADALQAALSYLGIPMLATYQQYK